VIGAPPLPSVNVAKTEVDVMLERVTMLGGFDIRGICVRAKEPETVLVPPPPAEEGLNFPDTETVALPSTACVTVNEPVLYT
jgi:hypothetical protein